MNTSNPATRVDRAEALALYQANVSLTRIGRRYGVTRQRIQQTLEVLPEYPAARAARERARQVAVEAQWTALADLIRHKGSVAAGIAAFLTHHPMTRNTLRLRHGKRLRPLREEERRLRMEKLLAMRQHGHTWYAVWQASDGAYASPQTCAYGVRRYALSRGLTL